MAKIIDIKPVNNAESVKKAWEASLSPARREALELHRKEKDIRRQLRNAEARQKRAAARQAMQRSSPAAAVPQSSRSAVSSQAPRAAGVQGASISGSGGR